MAVWQYSFELVSSKNFKDIKVDIFLPDIESIFGSILESNDNYVTFGNYEENRCSIQLHDNKIHEIYCRLDLRTISQDKVTDLKNLVEANSLKFLVIEEKILNGEQFIERLTKSSAMEFVKDPEKFIEDIASEGK